MRTSSGMTGAPTLELASLVREHQDMVFSIAFQYLRDAGAAEDVAQEVFLQLSQKLGALGSAEHAKAWLRTVTCHRAIDFGRRNSDRTHVPLDEAPEPAQPEAADPAVARELETWVQALPERMRMAVVLRYTEDLGPQEIAQVMGAPLNTVKSLLRRALERLRGRSETQEVGT